MALVFMDQTALCGRCTVVLPPLLEVCALFYSKLLILLRSLVLANILDLRQILWGALPELLDGSRSQHLVQQKRLQKKRRESMPCMHM
jgi:hypothetical protein